MSHIRYPAPLVCLLLACASLSAQQQTQPPLPLAQSGGGQQAAPFPPVADTSAVPFAQWLDELRKEAISKGISERTVAAALAGIEPLPVVIERDRTQAERTLALDRYLKRRLNRKMIRAARENARREAPLLGRVSQRYGVPRSVIVAIWGLESNFGRFSGVRPTVTALATLAYDNRRAALFREELFDALRILDRGDIAPEQMKGSWAGAMGQPQFMPSSYLRYAQDFDGDGKTDIWHSEADVFGSIASFLKEHGWQSGQPWGRGVKVPAVVAAKLADTVPLRSQGCEAVKQMTEAQPWSRWKAMGLRLEGRQKAPPSDTPASLVRAGSRNFLVFANYDALLQYNCAHAYALSVGLLADTVGAINAPPAPAAKAKGKAAKRVTKAPAKKRTPRRTH